MGVRDACKNAPEAAPETRFAATDDLVNGPPPTGFSLHRLLSKS